MKRRKQTPKNGQHQILVRLPVSEHRRLKAKADAELRSVNAEVRLAITDWLSPKAAPDPKPEKAAA